MDSRRAHGTDRVWCHLDGGAGGDGGAKELSEVCPPPDLLARREEWARSELSLLGVLGVRCLEVQAKRTEDEIKRVHLSAQCWECRRQRGWQRAPAVQKET